VYVCKLWNFRLCSCYSVICGYAVGPDAVVIKLVDRETLMKEREERLKVLLSFVKLLKCLLRWSFENNLKYDKLATKYLLI